MTECGPNQYIKWDLDANPPTPQCKDCYNLTQEEALTITDEESLVEFFREKSRDNDSVAANAFGDLSLNYRQCQNYESYTGIGTAAIAKMEANSRRVTVDTGTWDVLEMITGDYTPERLASMCNNGDNNPNNVRICEIINFYKNSDGYLEEPYLSEEIGNQFGSPNQVGISGSIDYNLPNLPAEYAGGNTIQDYKNAIHSKRGKYITDNQVIKIYLNGVSWFRIDQLPSPENIISEEIYDFWIELNRQDTTKSSDIGGINLQDLFSGQPSSTEFEICMNGLFDRRLHSNRNYDSDIQETISNHTSIIQLKENEINYIEDKLKVIATMEPDDAMECMNILNLGEMICDKGVSDRMLKMGYLVFHIIGLDKMDLDTIERGSKDYYHLTKILDRLTPYIRRAVRKILEISKHYELKTCGYESTTTHVLETIYMDVFEKTKEVDVHIDSLDFIPTYLIKDTNMMEFTRTIILLIVAIAGVYVLLMVLNRPVIK